jgi:hypothetical protein
MKTKIIDDTGGPKYKQTEDETCYNLDTSDEMVAILQKLRASQERIRVHYGYTHGKDAGRDWMEEHDVRGRISRSIGARQIPLLIYNARSMGGGGILTDCIVKITATNGGRVIYQHPKYYMSSVKFGV